MILYHPEASPRWQKYGIMIPLVDVRSDRVFEWLQSNGKSHLISDDRPSESFNGSDLCLVHDLDYVSRLLDEDLYFNEISKCFEFNSETESHSRYNKSLAKLPIRNLINDTIFQAKMSFLAMEKSLESGFCYFLGGGMHHAMSFMGRGFCLINDIVLGLKTLQKKGLIKTAWIIDVDVHRGDGCAQMTFNDSSIKTLSIHMKRGWPSVEQDKKDGIFYPSDVDIEIDSGEESLYVSSLSKGLEKLLNSGDLPDLVVVNHGADAFERDELESSQLMNLNLHQLKQRDLLLEGFFKHHSLKRCYLMSGGYGSESWRVYTQFFDLLKL